MKKSILKILSLYCSLFLVLYFALYLMMPQYFHAFAALVNSTLGTIILLISLLIIFNVSRKKEKTNKDCDLINFICKNAPLTIYSLSIFASIFTIILNRENTITSLVSMFIWNEFYIFSQKFFKQINSISEKRYRKDINSLSNVDVFFKDLPISINIIIQILPLFIVNGQISLYMKDSGIQTSIYSVSLFIISILSIAYISIDLYNSIKSLSTANSSEIFFNNEIGTLAYNINTNINKLKIEKKNQLRKERLEAIEIIRRTVDAKDSYTRGHSDRVSAYSVLIGQALNLSQKDLELLRVGGLFHDIGKIGIPDSILLKEGKLTNEEYDEIKKHPSIGAHILENSEVFNELIPIVLHHHEKFNGTGYPDNLKNEDIPRLARIVSVADTFDAMTSKRSYRNALPLDIVKDEFKKFSGSQFDPYVTETFLNILEHNYKEIEKIKKL